MQELRDLSLLIITALESQQRMKNMAFVASNLLENCSA